MELGTDKKWMTLGDVYSQFGDLATFREIFYDWMGLNQWLFFQINHLRAPYYDTLVVWVTELGERRYFPYIMALLGIFALLGMVAKRLKKQGGARQYAIRWTGVFLVLICGFLANALVITGMKEHFSMPRPYAAFSTLQQLADSQEKVYQLEQRPPEDAYRSFPSGHVAFITLMVMGLWPVLTERFRYFGLFLIFSVAWSRMSLGVHFPADTLWSFIIVSLMVILLRLGIYRAMRGLFGLNC